MPLSGTTAVGLTSGIVYATFNEAMASSFVRSTSGIFLTVSGQSNFLTTGHISGTYSMDPTGTIVAFAPVSGTLSENTWYIAYASASGIQAANGVFLSGSLYSGEAWQTVLNAVVSGTPASGTVISGGQNMTFVFSDTMDPVTVSYSGIFIVNSGQSNPATTGHISGVLEPLSAGSQTTIIQFEPNSGQLIAGNWYNAIVSSGCLDVWEVGISGGQNVTGNALMVQGPPVLSGTTPVSGATSVAKNTTILFTFSNNMAASTINTSGLYIVISGQTTPQTTGHLSGTVTLQAAPNNNVGQFIPNSGQFTNLNWYVAMVTSGVTDTFNNPLSGGAFFTGSAFQTISGNPGVITPQVSGTSPVSGAAAVISNIAPTIQMNTQVTSASVTTTSVNLVDIGVSGSTAPASVAGTVSISTDLTVVTFTPNTNLTNAHYHKIEVSGTIAVADGTTVQAPAFSGSVFVVEPVLKIVSQTPTSGTGTWSGRQLLTVLPKLTLNASGRTSAVQTGMVTASSVNMLYVHGSLTNSPITVSCQSDLQTIVVTPSNALNQLSGGFFGYRIDVSGLQDTANVTMTPYSGLNDFSTIPVVTISSTNPASGASSVAITSNVTLTMISGTVTSASVNTSTFLVVISGAGIPGTVSLSSDNLTVTFAPNSTLLNSSTYYIDVSGFSDTNGLTGFSGNGWSGSSFTTAAPPLTQIYNVGSNSSNHNLGNNGTDNYFRLGEGCLDTSSKLIGIKIAQASYFMKRVGNPTGTVYARVRDTNDNIKTTLGSISPSSISTSVTEVIFGPVTSTFANANGTKIQVEFSGGDSSNYFTVYKNGGDVFGDHPHTCFTRSTTTGSDQSECGSTDACGRMWK